MQIIQHMLCEAANALPDGRINILGAFVRLNFIQYPTTINMALVLRVKTGELDKGRNHLFTLITVDADGKPIAPPSQVSIPVSSQIEGDSELNIIVGINGLTFTKPGEYRVDVSIENHVVAQESFKMNLAQPPMDFTLPPSPPQ